MNLLQDVRFAFRMLAKNPPFTFVIIIVLALGIGANTTVFTLVNAVLFKGLPFDRPEQIMALGSGDVSKQRARLGVSYPDYLDWRAQSKSFQSLAALQPQSVNVSDKSGLAERLNSVRMSSNTFAALRQKPLLGRDLLPADEKPGAPAVCIIGYGVWKSRYGGDPNVIGRTVRLNEVPAVIVGVMPNGMRFPFAQDVWQPFVPTAESEKREARNLMVVGRLTDGVSVAAARADINTIAARLEKAYPKSNQGIRATVKPYVEEANGGPIRVVFLALLGAVGFVLLIACANVANLLLSRSLSRSREVSIRTALGASRWRLVRQLLVESMLLGVFGGLAGLALAVWGARMFDLAVANVGKPYWIKFTMDFHVFAYFAAVSLATGVLFGLMPALHVSKVELGEALKEGGRGSSGGSRLKVLSGALVISELALAVVLLSGAGLMIRSFLNLYGMDLGLRKDHLLVMNYILADAKYPTPEAKGRFHERLLGELQATPGVESAAIASNLPMEGAYRWKYEIEGEPPQESEKRRNAPGLVISPDYFRAVGVAVVRGRAFNAADGLAGDEVVIVNEQFAREHWPHGDALGRRVRLFREDNREMRMRVVGIVPAIRQNDPTQIETNALIYIPLRQQELRFASVIAHTNVPPASLAAAFKKAVQKIDENQPVFGVHPLEDELAQQRWPFRVFGSLFAIFAAIALVLSSVGIYAVMAYSVSQRTQEIGVRMALGASGANVLRLVFGLGMKQLGIGIALGLGAALAVTRVLKSLLVQITPTDPATFVIITALLGVVAALACWIPTRRAMRIDPAVALRYE